MSHPASRRDGFTSSFGVLAATLGSAVGLGNIWKFPYLTGANGGASFLVVYLLATLIVGLPVMMAEIMLGRAARANAVSTFEKLTPGKRRPWWLVGLAGALAAFLVLAFYSEVAGWVFAYVFKSLTNQVLTSDPNVAGRVFESMITDPWQALLWQWAVLAFIGAVVVLMVFKILAGGGCASRWLAETGGRRQAGGPLAGSCQSVAGLRACCVRQSQRAGSWRASQPKRRLV